MMSRIDSRHWKISTGRHFQNGCHNTAKIQHCPISSKFDMWVDNDVVHSRYPTNNLVCIKRQLHESLIKLYFKQFSIFQLFSWIKVKVLISHPYHKMHLMGRLLKSISKICLKKKEKKLRIWFPSTTVFSFYIFTCLIFRKLNKPQSARIKQQNLICIRAFDSRLYLYLRTMSHTIYATKFEQMIIHQHVLLRRESQSYWYGNR
jgi:hypothetical protein